LEELGRRIGECGRQCLAAARQRWERTAGMLRLLGPEGTLQRGYSITRDASGNLIRSVAVMRPGIRIRTRVSDGEFESEARP
jgi:exodeoxyribonuclease VII large subunit